MQVFDSFLMLLLWVATMGLAAWALIDALVRPATAFVAAGKLTKPAWAAITALALVFAYLTRPLQFFWLPAVIAAVVYLVDVRPAVRGLQRGGNNPW
jgi:hypothetical protein